MRLYESMDADLRTDGRLLRMFLACDQSRRRWFSMDDHDLRAMVTEEMARRELIFCTCCYEVKPQRGAGYDPEVEEWVCEECCDEYAD